MTEEVPGCLQPRLQEFEEFVDELGELIMNGVHLEPLKIAETERKPLPLNLQHGMAVDHALFGIVAERAADGEDDLREAIARVCARAVAVRMANEILNSHSRMRPEEAKARAAGSIAGWRKKLPHIVATWETKFPRT